MHKWLKQFGFTPASLFTIALITANAQLIYAFWDIRNTLPKDFPAAMGVTDAQAGQLYSMQGLVILLGTIALGWVGDRFSIRSIMMIATLGVGGISAFITFSSPHLSMSVLLICFLSMLLFSEVLFKPANFKALRVSTTEDHQASAFGLFEFGRGLLAFLISLLWTAMLAMGASARTIMVTATVIIFVAGFAVFFAVPKGQKVGDDDEEESASNTMEALKGVGHVAKMPIVWIAGINCFCIYGTFVAVGTYFARYLQAGYAAQATFAAVFATVVIALRMLPLVSTVLVEKVFKTTAHFMRLFEIILALIMLLIGCIFYTNNPLPQEFAPGNVPSTDQFISNGMLWCLIGLMIVAAACTFMVRGVYYAPIGEFGVPKKHSSAAMSFAITIGYIPALLAPIVLGGLIVPDQKDVTGQVVMNVMTNTKSLSYAFFGLAVLVGVAAVMSHILIKMKEHRDAQTKANA